MTIICPFYVSAGRHQKQSWKRQQDRTIGQCRIGLFDGCLILFEKLRLFRLIQRLEKRPQTAALEPLDHS